MSRRLREGAFILLCSLAIYLLIALITYNAGDPAWSYRGMSEDVHNAAGKTGAWFSDILYSLFGYMAYFFPIIFTLGGISVYRGVWLERFNHPWIWSIRAVGLLLAMIASCGLTSMHFSPNHGLPMTGGGLLGVAIKTFAISYLNNYGASLLLLALFLTGVTLFTGLSWFTFIEKVGSVSFFICRKIKEILLPLMTLGWHQLAKVKIRKSESAIVDSDPDDDVLIGSLPPMRPKKKIKPERQIRQTLITLPEQADPAPVRFPVFSSGAIPSLNLLETVDKTPRQGYNSAQLQELSMLVETRLLEFGVEAKVVGVLPGPVITRFELDLAAGIKVNKITGLAKDLARSLSIISVRVVEVIPGKSVVGLEIPNVHRELVRLKEVLEDPSYQQTTSPLSLALGKDIAGRPITVDLAKMPHLLVAGTTGSGKSVGLNAMLLSMLYKATPDDLRLILIDPKMLELAVYDHIPHLLTPVVTDMKDAANALRWCVAEMERRYQLMAAIGVRNLSGYNQRVAQAQADGVPLLDPLSPPVADETPAYLEKLPHIVVVVDEFADMMMVVGKKVEELIARIAQKARAAGIHLILATQRPSVDVITGLIKANIPTRIAFQVSSRIDSRTILDQSGAEQLLGFGDMLYLPPGAGIPHRIHGAFVSDEEVHKVTQALRKLGNPTYIENVIQSSTTTLLLDDEDADELYDQAVFIITQERKASISLIQRRLKIGYNRAARLIERMEAEGVVSLMQSNGMREVLAAPPVE